MANKVEQQIIDIIAPIIAKQELLLWDISYGKEGGKKILRILVDKQDHQFITMAEITVFTQEVNELLDTVEPDPIPEAYMLDISSPGSDRPLSQPWHFNWAKESNDPVLVSFFTNKEGQKKWRGKIQTVNDDNFVIITESGELLCRFDEVAKAMLDVQF